jgi:PAS domain S-box-containing protein
MKFKDVSIEKLISVRNVECLKTNESIIKGVKLLRQTKLNAIPVIKDDILVGIFTKSNLYDCLLNNISLDTPVKDVMTKNVLTRQAHELYENIEGDVKNSPVGQRVVLDDNRVIGMLTNTDIVKFLFSKADYLANNLSAIINAMENGLVTVNQEGIIFTFNPAAERLLGLKEHLMLGERIEDVVPQLELHSILKNKNKRINKKISFNNKVIIINCSPVSKDGKIVGALAILQDMTELERIAKDFESIKDLNQTLQTVVDVAYSGLVVIDKKGYITLMNKRLSNFLNIQAEDAVGKHITQVIKNSKLHNVAITGKADINDIQILKGQRVIVSRTPIINDKGQPVGAVKKIIFQGLREMKDLVRRLEILEGQVEHYKEELHKVKGGTYVMDNIYSQNDKLIELKNIAQRAARGSSTILIMGESGTGKELFAHAIHNASPRRNEPFIKINCAAIPENLLESEFFGYDYGAFSGARKGGKPGKFELADKGTIFLDEIGDMPLNMQAKLLRVLQDKEFERVGSTESKKVDVRIITASNKDLQSLVKEGKFRDDLFYRVNVITLDIPPLRERKDDIASLAKLFITKYSNILGVPEKDISPQAIKVLTDYPWPGNIRELENVIERIMNLHVGDVIDCEHLPSNLFEVTDINVQSLNFSEDYRTKLLRQEKKILEAALKKNKGNKTKAAKMLGISRSRFYEKLKVTGLL